MSYPEGEAKLLLLLQGMSQFDRANTSRGDWKPLNSGASDHYAVLRPGPFVNEADSFGGLGGGEATTTWRTAVEVWQRWKDDAPTMLALEGLVSAVMLHLERYPTLGGVCQSAQVAGGSEMQRRWIEQGGPLWAVQEVYIDWQEERFISVAE